MGMIMPEKVKSNGFDFRYKPLDYLVFSKFIANKQLYFYRIKDDQWQFLN